MTEITPFLKQLLMLPGLSGNEAPVREAIAEVWRPLVDELSTSKLGSLHGLRRGKAPEPRPSILLAGHMDAIGLMVTGIVDGFLRVTEVGGVDPRILPGQPVTVHARRELAGVVVQLPDRLQPVARRRQAAELGDLLVDTGLKPEEVKQLVKPGDLISFATQPVELTGGMLAGHSLDNRAAIAALTVCLQELQSTCTDWDLWTVATVQEEETLGGALTSPFVIRPSLAIAVDVTFGKGPGVSDYRGFAMDKGPSLGIGPNIHPYLYKTLKETAEKLEMNVQPEPMPAHSGTDATGMQVVAEGIPTAVIGIPLRYMHTPVEAVVLKDIERAGRLLARFVAQLTPDFLDKMRSEMLP